jgi:predicted NodU family carbamoyl transferase
LSVKSSRNKLIEFSDGLTDGGIIEDLFLVKAASNESGGAKAVNLAGNAARVFKDTFEGIVREGRTGKKTSDVEVVVNIINGLLEIERRDLVRVGESLAKSLMDGNVQGLVQGRWTYQEQGT